ncbi:MAG: hypothetical protein JKY20_11265 [Alphaproteobacteria bacterium]|nr:hypothetical protein [Alphaproteobacteria bacterium]
MKNMIKTTVFATAILALSSNAWAGALENMERERAIMLETLLSGDIVASEKRSRGAISSARLIDLERMVLRDKSLVGKNTPLVRAAFENYDLTFLVHAAAEKNRSPLDHWMTEIGVSTQTILNARTGRR